LDVRTEIARYSYLKEFLPRQACQAKKDKLPTHLLLQSILSEWERIFLKLRLSSVLKRLSLYPFFFISMFIAIN
jgi:hypothetical protein